MDRWVLGIDVGTSRSAGAIANGSIIPLEVEGNRYMPSTVLLDRSGTLVVGSAADYQAGVYPDRLERTPKVYLGGVAPLLLGDTAVEVEAAIARLIDVFVAEGRLRHGGRGPSATVLTHPVRWGDDRKAALLDAARRAGLDDAHLVEEPVAAAVHYVGSRVEIGGLVGVYDLGGGTFDTAVLRRTDDGFHVVGAPGGDEFIGGEHFDHLVYEYLGSCLAEIDPELWEQVQYGEDRRWTRAAADLLTQARRAKEAVSSYPATQVLLPLVDRDVLFTREQFEEMIRPRIVETVETMEATIASAGVRPEDLSAIYLVGGSSRIPLVTELMSARFGDRIDTRDEPKSVVALGAAAIARPLVTRTEPAPAPSPIPAPAPAPTPSPGAAAPSPPPSAPAAPMPTLHGLWGLDVGGAVHGIALHDADLSVTVADGTMHRLAAHGSWQWSIRLPAVSYGPPAPGTGLVHVGCADGQVLGIETRRGRIRWSTSLQTRILVPPVVAGDTVIAADEGGMVGAWAARDGSVRWLLPVGTAVRADLAHSGSVLFIPGADGRVFRADVTTGRVTWAFPSPEPVTVTPLAAPDLLVVAASRTLYGIDPGTGRARWSCTLPAPVDGPMARWGSSVIVAERSGNLHAVDAGTGAITRSSPTGGPNPAGVAVAGSLALLDNGAGELVAISLHEHRRQGALSITSGSRRPPVVSASSAAVASGSAVLGVAIRS